ncbi:hypothetical protein CXB51_025489 [Gossypium anomalum]|uniref:Uncharacterized protein n=1 Tax=Gossypium anomalum TaxID=47600 RepID=A0A8J6CSJ8_9ROSI|nr:hypothetical protein CXB51_025489 [Gossypium anomalum]
MASSLIRLDKKHISVDQMTMSSIAVDRELPAGNGFLACVHDRPGVQVGPETNQCIDREVETRDAHFPSSMRRVYYHSRICAIAIGIAGRWVRSRRLRDTFSEPDNDSTELERIRYAQAYILQMIGGYSMPDLSRNRQHCTGRCAGRRDRIKPKSEDAYHYCNHGHGFAFHFYVLEWNHSVSYVGIPTSLEDIRLLLDQRSEAQFQWTPYEDLAIWAVIPDEFFQNLNIWHVKVPLVNYARGDAPDPWQAIFTVGKGEATTIHVQRERRGPLNPIRRNDDACPSAVLTQSPGPSTVPTQPPGLTLQPTTPISHPFQIMPGAYPSPYMYPNPFMFPFPSPMAGWNAWLGSSPFPITLSQPSINRPPSHEGSHEAPSGSSSFTIPHRLMGFKHLHHG